MPRYIDADKLVEKYERAMKDVWNKKTRPLSWNEAYDCVITDIVDEPTAEVVPKSEVDRLNAVMKDMDEQRAYTINMLGENLENAKAEVERLQAENEKLTIKMNAYGLTAKRLKEDVDRLQEINNRQVEDVRLAKQEVAREIFAEIEKCSEVALMNGHIETPILCIGLGTLAELKKKYTEGD